MKGGVILMLTFYCYPKCGTCRAAKKWLDKHNISYKEINLFDNPPSREELVTIYRNSGLELKKFFNTSGIQYRELGLKDIIKTAAEDELLDILASSGRLIKRPILTDGKKVTVGFKEEEYEKTWL